MTFKKIFGKIYGNLFNFLKGSGLSKYHILLKLHVFLSRQLKSDYVDVYGFKLYLGKNDEGVYSTKNFYKDNYFDFLEKQIRKGDNVVDIGAKIGIYSLALSKFVGNLGSVFSFEPTPESFEILRKNKLINHIEHLVVEQKAVADKTSIEFLELCEFSGNNRINNNCINGISVECVSLDDYFSKFPGKISFIKIDVEGFEPKVISGMKCLLEKNQEIMILFEYNPKLIIFYGFEPNKLLENLTDKGFHLFDLEYDYYTPMNIDHFKDQYDNTRKLTNILARRK